MQPLGDIPEADLIERARRGDSSAFGELVCRHQDRLYHGLLHMSGSADDALDVVQDSFVQAYRKLDSFRGTSSFYTWIYRIAFNLLMTHKRRQRPQPSLNDKVLPNEPIDRRSGSPSDGIELQDRADKVRAALASLSDEYRQVLVLREMEDYDYETIAGLLGVPVGTVRSRLHRARLEMKGLLREAVEEDAI